MAKNNRFNRSKKESEPELNDIGLDEVDDFQAAKDEILLDKAGWNNNQTDDLSEEDEEQEVLELSDENSDEDDAEKIERYKKRFQGPIDDDEEEYFVDKDKEEEENEDEDQNWGQSKNDYYGADEIEEEEDVKALEEEALRLQQKHLEDLNMEDYMLDEAEEEWKKESTKTKEQVKEQYEDKKDYSKLDADSQLKFLENTYPEFLPLTRELKTLKPILMKLEAAKNKNESFKIKYTALATYLGTVATYFAMFLCNLQSGERFSMKDEPVMMTILNTREIWRQARELPNDLRGYKDADKFDIEVAEGEIDSEVDSEDVELQSDDEDVFEDENEIDNYDDDLKFDLNQARKVKKMKTKGIEAMDDLDAEEKSGRRKTLRFYTSKIDQREKKKDARFQGDQDLPYKERAFERQQRLFEEAKKRGDNSNSNAPGAALDGQDYDEQDFRVSDLIRSGDSANEDYYNSIASQKNEKKESRARAHELSAKAGKEGNLDELKESLGEDGKRAISYQILKNRGLTSKRKKDNRNSRVKKRKKYADAQKKLKSVRAVYKGQQGPYSGESTGIKKNLSKSVKLT